MTVCYRSDGRITPGEFWRQVQWAAKGETE